MNRPRTSFFWKLFSGYTALICLTAMLVGWMAHVRINHDSTEEIRSSLYRQAEFLSDLSIGALNGEDRQEFQAELVELGGKTGVRSTVIATNGTVIADSDEDPQAMDDHSRRPEVIAARDEGRGSEVRFSRTLDKNMMYCALPVFHEDNLRGYVRVSLPLTVVENRLAVLKSDIVTGMLIALVIGLLLAWLFARRVTQPLVDMTSAAELIASGGYGKTVHVATHDEMRTLADALNEMSESLAARIEEITRDHNQLEAMLGSMTEGVIAADSEERIVHINAVAQRLSSAEGDVSDMRTWEVLRIPALTEAIKQAIQKGERVEDEIEITQPEGDLFFDVDVAPWHDGSGTIVGAVAALHDVTRLRELERVRRDFVANASHELKSPITAIRGIAETMLNDPAMDEEHRERFVTSVLEESMRMSALVGDLLQISRLEQGRAQTKLEQLDLRKVAVDAVAAANDKARAGGIELSLDQGGEALPVMASAGDLQSALGNLIDNALKFTDTGGSVKVLLERRAGRAALEVRDTGAGIPREHLGRVFERFYRVDTARSRELGGTGLGLSIVKNVMQSHGGEVRVESTLGEGSLFTILLPLTGDPDSWTNDRDA